MAELGSSSSTLGYNSCIGIGSKTSVQEASPRSPACNVVSKCRSLNKFECEPTRTKGAAAGKGRTGTGAQREGRWQYSGTWAELGLRVAGGAGGMAGRCRLWGWPWGSCGLSVVVALRIAHCLGLKRCVSFGVHAEARSSTARSPHSTAQHARVLTAVTQVACLPMRKKAALAMGITWPWKADFPTCCA